MKYLSISEAAKKFALSERSVRNYCANGRIPGAIMQGKSWLIPEDASTAYEIGFNNLFNIIFLYHSVKCVFRINLHERSLRAEPETPHNID